MTLRPFKFLLVLLFGAFFSLVSSPALAGEEGGEAKLDPAEVIMEHIKDSHEWHFFTIKKSDGTEFHATIPLPVILYSPQRGLSMFSSSAFGHEGEEVHDG